MIYKFNTNKKAFIIKDKYEKYSKLLSDKKGKKNFKLICDICNKEEIFSKLKIIISNRNQACLVYDHSRCFYIDL